MLRDQCEDYCQCSYCKRPKTGRGNHSDIVRFASSAGRNKDEMYLRTLNESLRAKCLMASTMNSHRFRPDETLQSTRGDMARAALTVPVRRRDRLQELLILENKERMKTGRQLRQERRRAGLSDDVEDEIKDCAVGTDGDVPAGSLLDNAYPTNIAQQPVCSAEEDLFHALGTIKKITDEHGNKNGNQPLTTEQIDALRCLLKEQEEKTKKMIANCPEKEHKRIYSSASNIERRYRGDLQGTSLPSIHNGSIRRLKYNPHPYGSGVVWPPVESFKKDVSSDKCDSTEMDDDAYKHFQYPGSTHNKYQYGAKHSDVNSRKAETAPTVDHLAGPHYSKEKEDNAEGVAPVGVDKKKKKDKKEKEKEERPYKSTAALWRTTNQERAAQMERFLKYKKSHPNASEVYDESAVKRRTDDALTAITADAAAMSS